MKKFPVLLIIAALVTFAFPAQAKNIPGTALNSLWTNGVLQGFSINGISGSTNFIPAFNANDGLSIGASYLAITPPANGLIVQGNVGIGSSTPAKKLDVVGTLGATGAATFGSTVGITGDVAVATNKFNVTASSGNVAAAGTVSSAGLLGPAPVACGATCSPTGGQLVLLNQASGSVASLPTSAGTGNVVRFRVTVATSSLADKILLTTTADTIIGTAVGENAGTAKIFVGNASTYHSIQMPFAGSQPSGGFIGDQITCTDIAAGIWACDMNYQAGTTPTTPYSASTT